MRRNLFEKLKEASQSVLPISAIVLLLHFTIAPMPLGTFTLFIMGTILLIIGIAIFTIGVDMAMMPMGEIIGAELIRSRKLWLLIAGCFILGTVVTIAEPDLQVLSKQVPAVPDMILVSSVAIGVGIFMVIAVLRILFKIRFSYLLIAMYAIVFIVAALTVPDYLAVSFDAAGVTTGPITVPFILALGIGISAVRSGKDAEEDSFGLCGICSIGPMLAVLITGIFFKSSEGGYAFETSSTVNSLKEFLSVYGSGFILFIKEACIILLPIVLIFGFFQVVHLKLSKIKITKIAVGIIYTFIGLALFLTGVNIGFLPAATYIGGAIASLPYNWVLIPIGGIMGFFIVMCEPAVPVLIKQVEEITSGAVSRRMMTLGMSTGVGIALALSMIRIMTGTSIWFFMIPGYAIALILTFFVPRIFTPIAFDSGGVSAGVMSAAFLIPFAVGVSTALGGNLMTDAFGIVAMVAMMPIITVQIIGVIYNIKMRRANTADITEDSDMETEITKDTTVFENITTPEAHINLINNTAVEGEDA